MIIGLTGGIASGKSTVSALFVRKGAALVDADVIAREVMLPGHPVLAAAVEALETASCCLTVRWTGQVLARLSSGTRRRLRH